MTTSQRQTARSWRRSAGAAAGTAVAAAAIPLVAAAAAHADTTSTTIDLLGSSADLITGTAIPDIGSLADVDILAATPGTIPEAITAALAPIVTAGNDIDNALLAPGLSSAFEAILNGQSQVLDSQTELVNVIGDIQAGFTGVDLADLIKLDDLLTVANTNVLDATTDLISTAGDPSALFSAGLDLVSADLGALFTDFQVAGIGASADLLGMLGIDPSFLFDGLGAF